MTQSLYSRAGLLTLIAAVHGAVLLWVVNNSLLSPEHTPAAPLPMVMVDMVPLEQPVKPEVPPPPKPVPPEPQPQPKKTPPKPQPKKEAPKTTTSDKALTAPKQEVEPTPQAPTTAPEPAPAPPSPPAPPAPAAPPAPVTPPRFNAAYLNNPAPVYPPMLRRTGEEGKVVLRVFVTAEGAAGNVQVLHSSGSPLFDEAALTAVRKWRFVPARRGDTPIAEWVQVPIEFRLN